MTSHLGAALVSALLALGLTAMPARHAGAALVAAVKRGDMAAVRALVQRRADVNARRDRRNHGAALGGARGDRSRRRAC